MKKILIAIFVVLLLALAGAGIYIYNVFNSFEQGVSDSYESTDREYSELREQEDDVDETPGHIYYTHSWN